MPSFPPLSNPLPSHMLPSPIPTHKAGTARKHSTKKQTRHAATVQ